MTLPLPGRDPTASRRSLLTGVIAGLIGAAVPPLTDAAAQTTVSGAGSDPSAALLGLAQTIVATLTQTEYTHDRHIVPEMGIYDTDCSGFVDYLMDRVAPAQYRLVPKEPGFSRPRAFMYEQFFDHLQMGVQAPGWQPVPSLLSAAPGDLIAWGLYPVEQYHDTGHITLIMGAPIPLGGSMFSVPVIDASAVRHYDDTRVRGVGGVGTGRIHFQVDLDGAPTAFQFDQGDHVQTAAIRIGRLQPDGG